MSKISSPRLIERVAENLGDLLSLVHAAGSRIVEHLLANSGKMTKKARYNLRNGASSLAELEDEVTSRLQARPLAYLLVTLGLASVIGLKILLDRQKQAPGDE